MKYVLATIPYHLLPRDALHLAIIQRLGLNIIASDDADFDCVDGFNRLWLFNAPTSRTAKANELFSMLTINLLEQTKAFLDETLSSELDTDAKVRQLIRAEYLRELSRFRRADLAMAHKYSVTFDEFIAQSMVEQLGYSWEVEQDAMNWETAVGGILTMERKLKRLQELDNEFTV